MKRIQLTDGMPTTVKKEELVERTALLCQVFLENALKSGLSYQEINKALHVADEELYRKALEKPFSN